MQLSIAQCLTIDEISDIATTLSRMRFEDGRATAGWNARLVKSNEQAAASVTLDLLRNRVTRALRANPVFEMAVRPKALSSLIFSRTGEGQGYGSHIDNPIMDGLRTDVSFTLFLSDPDSYDGGELVMETASGEEAIKLPAGAAFVYPSTTLHRVNMVKRGQRLAAVGWAQSYIRDASRRELLFELETARRRLFDLHGKTAEFDLLSKCHANLVRMWSEA